MLSILDPVKLWLGQPPLALSATNKRPVALFDTVSLLMDTGPVSIAVLDNDFDPEGGPVSLVSAFAALGTAVAETDGTVSYTPPPGFSGPDTITYEIADDLDQRRTGQVNVTVTEPQLSVDVSPDNTLTVTAETGLVDIDVTEPAIFAGSYQVDTSDLSGGPVNLVPPRLQGALETGSVLTAIGGLWVYDTGAGVPDQGWQWRRGGVDIAGATGATYTLQASDIGPGVTVTETLTDGFGARSAESAAAATGFSPADDAGLLGWWDADDALTLTTGGAGEVSAWADKAGSTLLQQLSLTNRPVTGSRSLGGRNVLDFTGNAYLLGNMVLPVSGDVALHMVLEIDNVANAFAAVVALEALNDMQIDADSATAFNGRLNPSGIGSATPLSGGPFSGALILSAVFDRTGTGQAEIHIGNTLRGTMAYTAALDSVTALHLMTNRSKNAWIDGAVAEVIVTETVSNRAQHHGYLAAKWGVS